MTKDNDDSLSMAAAFGDAKRIVSDKLHIQRQPPKPEARFTRSDQRAVLAESLHGPEPFDLETGEELTYRTDGVPESVFRKLRRGRLSVAAEIDLHGLNLSEAKQHLREFLVEARKRRLHCVRVIHGKGKRSGQRGPVLRNMVDRRLREWSEVLAFCTARPADGGTGAVYVLLKKH